MAFQEEQVGELGEEEVVQEVEDIQSSHLDTGRSFPGGLRTFVRTLDL